MYTHSHEVRAMSNKQCILLMCGLTDIATLNNFLFVLPLHTYHTGLGCLDYAGQKLVKPGVYLVS